MSRPFPPPIFPSIIIASLIWIGGCDGIYGNHATSASDSTNSTNEPVKPSAEEENSSGDFKIVNGTDASDGEYPFIVYADGCDGTLISPSWVMTAAHCSSLFNPGKQVNIGGWKVNDMYNGTSGEWRTIASRTCHPAYNDWSMNNDFCLVQLTSPSTMPPITIDISSASHVGENAIVIGWGDTSNWGGSPNTLQEAVVPIVSNAQCNSDYGGGITDAMVCAGNGTSDACQGDSGGPFLNMGANTLLGVVSWGYDCNDPNYPGVYARVAEVADWICDTTGNAAFGCSPNNQEVGAGTEEESTETASCNVANPNWIGDGYCDDFAYNNADCDWDGGDCCENTCTNGAYSCGSNGYQCLDPDTQPAAACGDGEVNPGEQCDDGNTNDGDGCDANCMTEVATCTVENPQWIGDGWCDDTQYNNADCGWDGGDCCASTCTDGEYACGIEGYDCRDPGAQTCNAPHPNWIGDGWCDGEAYNNSGCGWDGGDCCASTCTNGDYACGANGYSCSDPDAG